MEIVVRTDTAETVVRPESGSGQSASGASGGTPASAGAATSAGPAPSGPDSTGAPPANVAASEPPRSRTAADESAGAAPELR